MWRGKWHEFDLGNGDHGQEGHGDLQPPTNNQQPPTTNKQQPTTTMSPDIRGFIFDLDGVLTDTAEYHYLAWQKLADEEGFPSIVRLTKLCGVYRVGNLFCI